MPFFTVFLILIIQTYLEALIHNAKSRKKDATLQVRAPLTGFIRFRRKRVWLFSSIRFHLKGSMSVEAALGFSLFLFACICMMMPMKIMDKQRQIQAYLENMGESLSQYAYLRDGEKGTILSGAAFLEEQQIKGKTGQTGIENISFGKSRILDDGETVWLIMNYEMKLPFSVLGLELIPLESRSVRRAWIGRDGPLGEGTSGTPENSQEHSPEVVFVGKNSTRYHKTQECHYLSNNLTAVSYEDLETCRNNGGSRYHACRVCADAAGPGSTVYIMPEGESYHSQWHCSATIAYVKEISIDEAEHLGKCSYCW